MVGLGIAGSAMCRFLIQEGHRVIGNDHKVLKDVANASKLEAEGVELVVGGHPESVPADVDRIVVSPGVPRLPLLVDAEKREIPIHGELDLLAPHLDAQLVAITGTNGKSTVTSLVGEMCEALGKPVFVGGNLGQPAIEALQTPAAKGGVVVLELSSFQLEHASQLRPHVAAVLNLSDDHLDRYDDFEHYARTKVAIAANQKPDDVLVIPADPELAKPIEAVDSKYRGKGTVLRFGGSNGDVRLHEGTIRNGLSGLSVERSALGLAGAHNVDNACAAAAIARALRVPVDAIEAVLKSYKGLPHRMRFVAEKKGVRYYNDSKATNVGAAVAALRGAGGDGRRVLLIAGGKDKGGSYAPLAEAMADVGRAILLIGAAAKKISAAMPSDIEVIDVGDLRAAVDKAAELASPGDVVLLAPACSSYDQFQSYKERGNVFEQAVEGLS